MLEKVRKNNLLHIPERLHTVFTLFFLFLLGSHLFDFRLEFLLPFVLLLINWKRVLSLPFIVLALFMLSVYATWYLVYYPVLPVPMRTWTIIGPIVWQGVLVIVMYLLGSSVRFSAIQSSEKGDKYIFYMLFSFFIAYTLVILWSYMTLAQDSPLTDKGMFVAFENAYHASGVDGGRLISTIIAYYLVFMVMLLPLLTIHFDVFRKQGFSLAEWIFLVVLAIFALYLSNEMGRRIVIVLFGFSLLYSVGYRLFAYIKEGNIQKSMIILVLVFLLAVGIVYVTYDTPVMQRLIHHQGFHDRRFGFWIPALKAMWAYPFGGAHEVFVANSMKLAHNTFLDIGKDYGIIPFVLIILFLLMHIPYFIRVVLSPKVSLLVRHLVILVSIGFLAIFMIEPVFNSDRIFFAYGIFFAAFVRQYALSSDNTTVQDKCEG